MTPTGHTPSEPEIQNTTTRWANLAGVRESIPLKSANYAELELRILKLLADSDRS